MGEKVHGCDQPHHLLALWRAASPHPIGDVEALLIQTLGTHHRENALKMRFGSAREWTQIMEHEVDAYLAAVHTH